MIYLDLLIGFLKVGLFSFGGGYAAIPLIRDVVLSHGWMSEDMLTYMIAVSESTPGPIMVNLATYVGTHKAGIPGAIIATLASIIPAFVIMILVASLLAKVLDNKYVKAVLGGLIPCITGIIFSTGALMIIKNCVTFEGFKADFTALILTAVLALIYFGSRYVFKKKKFKISPIMLIGISAVLGVIVYGV